VAAEVPVGTNLAGSLNIVRQSKFRKSRLVPLHPTAQAGLDQYLVLRGETVSTRLQRAYGERVARRGGADLACPDHRGRPRPVAIWRKVAHTVE
jgi:hypothetical protein